MNMLQRQWRRRKKQIAIYWISILIAYASGLAIDAAIYLGDDANHMVPLGVMFALFMLIMVRLIAGSMYVTLEFQLAISMSTTRRNFMREYLSLTFLEMVCYYVMLCVMFKLECMIWQSAVGLTLAEEVTTIMSSLYLYTALGLLGLLVIELLGGALILRFGVKIFWVFWAIIMLPSVRNFTNVRFLEGLHITSRIGELFSQIGRPGVCGIILCAELIAFIFAYRLMKRQQIA